MDRTSRRREECLRPILATTRIPPAHAVRLTHRHRCRSWPKPQAARSANSANASETGPGRAAIATSSRRRPVTSAAHSSMSTANSPSSQQPACSAGFPAATADQGRAVAQVSGLSASPVHTAPGVPGGAHSAGGYAVRMTTGGWPNRWCFNGGYMGAPPAYSGTGCTGILRPALRPQRIDLPGPPQG